LKNRKHKPEQQEMKDTKNYYSFGSVIIKQRILKVEKGEELLFCTENLCKSKYISNLCIVLIPYISLIEQGNEICLKIENIRNLKKSIFTKRKDKYINPIIPNKIAQGK